MTGLLALISFVATREVEQEDLEQLHTTVLRRVSSNSTSE